jgi:hypothetical protein
MAIQAIDGLNEFIGSEMDSSPIRNGGGGGGGGSYSSPLPVVAPTARSITFNVESTPNGAAIYVNGEDTGYTTPHSLQFAESELFASNKIITLINGSNKSEESYILSAQLESTPTSIGTTTNSGGSGGGGGGGAGRPYNERDLSSGIFDVGRTEQQFQ